MFLTDLIEDALLLLPEMHPDVVNIVTNKIESNPSRALVMFGIGASQDRQKPQRVASIRSRTPTQADIGWPIPVSFHLVVAPSDIA